MTGKLTVLAIKALSKPGWYGAGGGLWLRVAPNGRSRSWVLRSTAGGKRQEIGLGGFPVVSLADARAAAFEYRQQIRSGRDPLAEKRAAARKEKMPTFEAAARAFHEANLPRWRNGKHTNQWLATLALYAFPAIGSLPVDRIGREDVLRVLTPIWTAKPETARRGPATHPGRAAMGAGARAC